MKSVTNHILLFAFMAFGSYVSMAQTSTANTSAKSTKMKTYLIERDIPGAGKLTPEQLKGISQKSFGILKEMGPQIEWIQSYVTDDKVFCIYKAESEELIREHAKKGGFPANKITEVSSGISPATAQAN
ncbi:MAG: DUF4242 domain-containing protein [Ginsengibacter sp.]